MSVSQTQQNPHLYTSLEATLREGELSYSMALKTAQAMRCTDLRVEGGRWVATCPRGIKHISLANALELNIS